MPILDPSDCNDVTLHIPGCTQPHGLLFLVDPVQFTIQQLSANIKDWLGRPAEPLVGRSLSEVLGDSQCQKIAQYLEHPNSEVFNPFDVTITHADGASIRTQGTVQRVKTDLLLELEPKPSNLQFDCNGFQFYHQLKQAIATVRHSTNLSELTQHTVEEVRRITQFDRVMIYQFEADQSGVVIAESKRDDLDSYLGLHYPASDIPQQARQFYYDHWTRCIPDVNYEAVPLVPNTHPKTGEPLDLSLSTLRSVFSGHLEYLRNMGVRASFSISLINERRLWGLIVCHHDTPKLVDYETRKACEFLGQFLSIEFVHQQERDARLAQHKIQDIQSAFQRSLPATPEAAAAILYNHEQSLLDLVNASGAAIALDNQLYCIGQTPSTEAIQKLIHWLSSCQEELFYTDTLSRWYPDATAYPDLSCGLLSVAIVLKQTSYRIIWFRPEQWQTVNWAGNPHDKTYRFDDQGIARLSPRGSFELWKETVRDRSLPWKPVEIESARQLRTTLMVAALEFSHMAVQKAAEQARLASLAKSQFLAKMSHELRTPLNAILGFTQVMSSDRSLSQEHQEHLGIIGRSGEHLLELINDVLEMSKIEAGQIDLHETPFDLHAMLGSIREMFILKAASKGIELSIVQRPDVPKMVHGDPGKIRQILINLIGNAIKFTERGCVSLDVVRLPAIPSARDDNKPMVWLEFRVQDTGSGIATDDLATVFDAFVQVDRKRQFIEGSGLGLAISRQFARLMNGDIVATSIEEQGSTFVCTVQLQLLDHLIPTPVHVSNPIIGLKPGQPNYRILVAEDVPENRMLLTHLLRSVGFEVYEATNGQEAIAQWQKHSPHIILMDLQMPEMDGLAATQAIRTSSGEPAIPIIIAVTANAFDEDRVASLNGGCNDFMSKPFQTSQLFELIHQYLGVDYIYADNASLTSSYSSSMMSVPVRTQDLMVMPQEWRQQLRDAALVINEERLCQLLDEIPHHHSDLAIALRHLIDNFQLETIVNLTS
jgi:light-regulated signal transduction histidine kinase (bacteriophytochrome)/CheY-like chemotaxis protein